MDAFDIVFSSLLFVRALSGLLLYSLVCNEEREEFGIPTCIKSVRSLHMYVSICVH